MLRGSGWVTRFEVKEAYLDNSFTTSSLTLSFEYWIPSEDPAECNRHIRGQIEVVNEYR